MKKITASFSCIALIGILASLVLAQQSSAPPKNLWRNVEVVRTTHGVPHIRAKDLLSAGYALAWLQCEDYGPVTAMEVLEASGRMASVVGYERIESAFLALRERAKTAKNYHLLLERCSAGLRRFCCRREPLHRTSSGGFSGRHAA